MKKAMILTLSLVAGLSVANAAECELQAKEIQQALSKVDKSLPEDLASSETTIERNEMYAMDQKIVTFTFGTELKQLVIKMLSEENQCSLNDVEVVQFD